MMAKSSTTAYSAQAWRWRRWLIWVSYGVIFIKLLCVRYSVSTQYTKVITWAVTPVWIELREWKNNRQWNRTKFWAKRNIIKEIENMWQKLLNSWRTWDGQETSGKASLWKSPFSWVLENREATGREWIGGFPGQKRGVVCAKAPR